MIGYALLILFSVILVVYGIIGKEFKIKITHSVEREVVTFIEEEMPAEVKKEVDDLNEKQEEEDGFIATMNRLANGDPGELFD